MAEAAKKPLPVVDFLKIPESRRSLPRRSQVRQLRRHLPRRARGLLEVRRARQDRRPTKLSNEGTLYVYSIVHRSFPGIEVPYVSAIVDLDGGGTVKGNLIGVEPDPEKIKIGMPVEVVYKDALGRKDREGNSYLSLLLRAAPSEPPARTRHARAQGDHMSDVYVVGIDMIKFMKAGTGPAASPSSARRRR